MPQKTAAQIRKDFLEFFSEKGHAIVPSAPVVPRGDATLLFTNAGMNQFKPIFLGEEAGVKQKGKIWKRAVDTQRCIRVSGKHNDLEEVGRDTYHHTFFEMLGNWSFGDYFKKEAVAFAWELLTEEWELESDRLYATVFEGDETDGLPADDEAAKYWACETEIDETHILKCSKKDNFWEMGNTGPCGPCSEVHIDLRDNAEREKVPGTELVNKDHPEVMEIWNLVFIQFNRKSDGSLVKLPQQHVDTGMGFERMCAVLQGKSSNYDTDLFTPLLNKIEEIAGVKYGNNNETDIAMQVIADHIRSISFAIADGASPDNEGRGYVVRRILRRAVRFGWDKLDLKKPFLHRLVPVLAEQFEDVFPVLTDQQDYVINVIEAEEKSFLKTLGKGIELFNEMVDGSNQISGEDAFKLHDTYGFPIDLTELMAREKGIEVDKEGFEAAMQKQKDRARAAGSFDSGHESEEWTKVNEGESVFVGYDELTVQTKILAYRNEGENFVLLLKKTPFYAESGGQVADTGIITNGEETMRVIDVQKGSRGFLHYVDSLADNLSGEWQANIDAERRREIMKHHSATHLIHAALRQVVGKHVKQKGSFVNEDHLRFDFSHFEQISEEQLNKVEKIVNDKIQQNIKRGEDRDIPINEAKERGVVMMADEKYGDKVRVISFDPEYSLELCGGTHVEATGEIGYFRFLNESSAAAGIRRIEGTVGRAADEFLRDEKEVLQSIKLQLGSDELNANIERLIIKNKQLEKENEQLKQKQASLKLEEFIKNARTVNGSVQLVAGEVENADMDTLKQMGYESLEKSSDQTVTILGSRDEENVKVYITATVTQDLIDKKGLKAGALVGIIGRELGGGGGGQPHLASAGGNKPERLAEVLEKAEEFVKREMTDVR